MNKKIEKLRCVGKAPGVTKHSKNKVKKNMITHLKCIIEEIEKNDYTPKAFCITQTFEDKDRPEIRVSTEGNLEDVLDLLTGQQPHVVREICNITKKTAKIMRWNCNIVKEFLEEQ